MIDIRCPEHLAKCEALADNIGPEARKSLDRCLYSYADDQNRLIVIVEDRSPYSFYINVFTLSDRTSEVIADDTTRVSFLQRYWYNGGIIYSEASKTWSTHT